MPQIAIFVELETLPGQQAQFEEVIREHARRATPGMKAVGAAIGPLPASRHLMMAEVEA